MSVVDRSNSDERSGVLDQSVDSLTTATPGSLSACGDGSQQSCKRSRIAVSSLANDTDERRTFPVTRRSAVDETFVSLADDAVPCIVCGDAGTGFHYSVYTCEKCQEFFRHTTEKNLHYECERQKKCVVDKYSCEKCRYCWLSRCLAVGMRKRGHTPDDITRSKRRRFEPVENQQRNNILNIQLLKNDSSLSEEDEQLISQLVNAKPYLVPKDEDIFRDDKSGQGVDTKVLLNFGYAELQLVTDWSRKVPGFCDLLLEDQISLLKSSYVEVGALRVAFRSLDCVNALRLTDAVCLHNTDILRAGCGGELIQAITEFISRLRIIGIDKTEFSILCAVVLTYPDAAGIIDRTAVLTLQSRLLFCLQRYSSSRYPATPYRYGKILLRLPALRTISARLSDRFLSISLDDDVRVNSFAHRVLNDDVAGGSVVSG